MIITQSNPKSICSKKQIFWFCVKNKKEIIANRQLEKSQWTQGNRKKNWPFLEISSFRIEKTNMAFMLFELRRIYDWFYFLKKK